MNYRIKTDGEDFIIEYHEGGEWKTVSERVFEYLFLMSNTNRFKSERAAERYAKKRWGTSACRVREWRVV